jgi:hypothetical protein
MHNFTPEDLLLYLYKETSKEKTEQIKTALETDWNLREQFDLLTVAQSKLEAVVLAPGQKTIDNILAYAEKSVNELTPQA